MLGNSASVLRGDLPPCLPPRLGSPYYMCMCMYTSPAKSLPPHALNRTTCTPRTLHTCTACPYEHVRNNALEAGAPHGHAHPHVHVARAPVRALSRPSLRLVRHAPVGRRPPPRPRPPRTHTLGAPLHTRPTHPLPPPSPPQTPMPPPLRRPPRGARRRPYPRLATSSRYARPSSAACAAMAAASALAAPTATLSSATLAASASAMSGWCSERLPSMCTYMRPS